MKKLVGIFSMVAFASALFVGAAKAGDASSGQIAYEEQCTGCHALDVHRAGPRHRGVIGRPAGSLPDFDYSPALRRANFVWTEALLVRWLEDPEKLVPGSTMGFTIADTDIRADIAAYLASLPASVRN